MIHYPRYVGSYLKKTVGLSMLEDGAYSRLLDYCYANETHILPLKREKVHRIARCESAPERAAVDRVLEEFFDEKSDGWHQERAEEELEKFRGKSTQASAAAIKRWQKRKAKAMRPHSGGTVDGDADGDASQSQSQSKKDLKPLDPPGPVGPKPDVAKPADAKALNATAFALLGFLNEKTTSRYQPVAANIKPIVALLKQGFTEKQIRQVIANRVLKWVADPKMAEYLRPKTLFGPANFANYAGQLGKPVDDGGGSE